MAGEGRARQPEFRRGAIDLGDERRIQGHLDGLHVRTGCGYI
jgi:hypothetical protein